MAAATLSPLALPAILGPLSIATNLLVLGAHVVVPWRLAMEDDSRRRSWALVSLPLLLLATLLTLLRFSLEPDRLLAGGFESPLWAAPPARALALLMLTLVLVDVVLLLAATRLERNAWWLVAAVGLAALFGLAYFAEALSGLDDGPGRHLARAALRACASVGLGAALVPAASRRSPLLAVAAVAVVLYLPLLPHEILLGLWKRGELLFAVAAAVLLFATRLLQNRSADGTGSPARAGRFGRVLLLLAALALGCFWSLVGADASTAPGIIVGANEASHEPS